MQLGGRDAGGAYAGKMPREGRGHGRAAGHVLQAQTASTGVDTELSRAYRRKGEGVHYTPVASAFTYIPLKFSPLNGCGRE